MINSMRPAVLGFVDYMQGDSRFIEISQAAPLNLTFESPHAIQIVKTVGFIILVREIYICHPHHILMYTSISVKSSFNEYEKNKCKTLFP